MKYIGLDVGDRRVGVAFGDSELRLATPVDIITRATTIEDARVIGRLVREFDAAELIVGLPRNMDGTSGGQAESVIAYAEQIGRTLSLPVVFWDERLTTVEAKRRTQEAGEGRESAPGVRGTRSAKKTRRRLDASAAAVILQDYIDSKGNANS